MRNSTFLLNLKSLILDFVKSITEGWYHVVGYFQGFKILWFEKIGLYHKHGKIHWAKYLWFQSYEVFCGNTFMVPWPAVFIV